MKTRRGGMWWRLGGRGPGQGGGPERPSAPSPAKKRQAGPSNLAFEGINNRAVGNIDRSVHILFFSKAKHEKKIKAVHGLCALLSIGGWRAKISGRVLKLCVR